MRCSRLFVTLVTAAAASITVVRAQTPSSASPASAASSIVGGWTLNRELSNLGPTEGRGDGREGDDEGRRGGRGGGGRGGGGFGGGVGGRGFGNERAQNAEAAQRMRNALRDEMLAPDQMTIAATETTIIITTTDGRTTRLSADGQKVKDESTGIERKTKWIAGRLVSEISGLGRGKITETYSVDAELKQLRVELAIDGPRKTSQTRVYDLNAQ